MTRICNQVSLVVRFACETVTSKVKPVGKWLKGEAYFQQKMVGSKPVPGLLTTEEFSLCTADWERRRDHIHSTYGKYKDTEWPKIIGDDRLAHVMSDFSSKKSKNVQNVEKAVSNRIPQLLITTGRGKNQQTAIVKGSTLEDKIIAIVPKPRTVANIMWSPTIGLTQSFFADAAIRLARSRLLKNLVIINEFETAVQKAQPEGWKIYVINKQVIDAAVDLIINLFNDHKEEPEWSGMGR
jgi:hypothetical protein